MIKNPLFLVLLLLGVLSCSGQARKSDKETDGLKGSVKSVITQQADVRRSGGRLIEGKRQNREAVTYDRRGRRKSMKSYDSGALFESTVYKIIGGEKVLINKVVKNDNVFTGGPLYGEEKTSTTPTHARDSRYHYMLKYKYDRKGNVIEEVWLFNDGSLWMKYTYEFEGSEIRELAYAQDGSLNQKMVHFVNKDGNEIRVAYYELPADSVDETDTYKYLAFDKRKNWTKRYVFHGDKDGPFSVEPAEIEIRTISYY